MPGLVGKHGIQEGRLAHTQESGQDGDGGGASDYFRSEIISSTARRNQAIVRSR